MKDGKDWWVEPGVLTSVHDPTTQLAAAADQFPSEYVPMVFMTGDGHARPAFGWTGRGFWPDFFREIVDDDKVCCYVETFADQVTADRVPPAFLPVFQHHEVFGWEPPIYRAVGAVFETIIGLRLRALMPQPAYSVAEVRSITDEIRRIGALGFLPQFEAISRQYRGIAEALGVNPVPLKHLHGFLGYLEAYHEKGMEMRTSHMIHAQVAATIQAQIDKHPDHLHLISCGGAHITNNPLYRYIRPPVGTFGVADQGA